MIKKAKLREHRGSKSTTYSVEAEYKYEFKGVKHSGSKVSNSYGSDSISSFHKDLYRKLRKCLETGEPYHCYVNPANPDEAILNRWIRPLRTLLFIVFSCVFGGAGVFLMFVGLKAVKRAKTFDKLKTAYPDQPWMWREDWRRRVIRPSDGYSFLFLGVLTVAWNLISIPILLVVFPRMNASEAGDLKYLFMLFPAVGCLLAALLAVSWLKRRKLGAPILKLDSNPGVVGRRLTGKIILPSANLGSENGIVLNLRCVEIGYSAGNRSRSEDVLWESEKIVHSPDASRLNGEAVVEFAFDIPYTVHETSLIGSSSNVEWRIIVRPEPLGSGYLVEFEVPVFKTEASDPEFALDAVKEKVAASELSDAESALDIVKQAGIKVAPSYSGYGSVFTFPMGRNCREALSMTLFAVVWSGITAALLYFGAPIVFVAFWGLINAGLVLGMLNAWLYWRRVEVDQYSVKLSGGFMGIGSRREVDVKDIEAFTSEMTYQSNEKTFYEVLARAKNGKTIKVVSGLQGKSLADAFIAMLEMNTGKSPIS